MDRGQLNCKEYRLWSQEEMGLNLARQHISRASSSYLNLPIDKIIHYRCPNTYSAIRRIEIMLMLNLLWFLNAQQSIHKWFTHNYKKLYDIFEHLIGTDQCLNYWKIKKHILYIFFFLFIESCLMPINVYLIRLPPSWEWVDIKSVCIQGFGYYNSLQLLQALLCWAAMMKTLRLISGLHFRK